MTEDIASEMTEDTASERKILRHSFHSKGEKGIYPATSTCTSQI